VIAVPQPPGPRPDRARRPRDVEQLVHEMGPVVEQHAAAAVGAPPTPRHRAPCGPWVRREPVDPELRKMPTADQSLIEPALHSSPRRVIAVLVARHEDPPRAPCRGGE